MNDDALEMYHVELELILPRRRRRRRPFVSPRRRRHRTRLPN